MRKIAIFVLMVYVSLLAVDRLTEAFRLVETDSWSYKVIMFLVTTTGLVICISDLVSLVNQNIGKILLWVCNMCILTAPLSVVYNSFSANGLEQVKKYIVVFTDAFGAMTFCFVMLILLIKFPLIK